jgi:hypothetical protein
VTLHQNRLQHPMGRPEEGIVKAAEFRQANRIIVGSHGRTGLQRLLMGSVAERVIGHATCPVLVVKEEVIVGCARPAGISITAGFNRRRRQQNAWVTGWMAAWPEAASGRPKLTAKLRSNR